MEESKTTKDVHFSDGSYSDSRKKLHDEIIQMLIRDKGSNEEVGVKEALIIGGGSGSGKSYVVEEIIGKDGYVIIDADIIKELIPEYRIQKLKNKNTAADIVHPESSDIALSLLDYTISKEESFIYDGTMKNKQKYFKILKKLQSKGYTTQMVIIDADLEVAIQRTIDRFADPDDGRFVPREKVIESNRLISNSFIELKGLVDSYSVFDNSINGEEPRIIAYKDPDEEEVILSQEAYDKFLKKSNLLGSS
ncbi:zeta toxin family protein [Bacillus subtilis]|uniref:zeta toxin family protein n=1 Tax=Bacillus subtilis TaxID=1423 RepID=UPI0024C07FD8|nr:zeta toxin family protein [Bacillus subtilis]MDK1002620.1 zeta toxin family protein [Bacillus subtilis]